MLSQCFRVARLFTVHVYAFQSFFFSLRRLLLSVRLIGFTANCTITCFIADDDDDDDDAAGFLSLSHH